MAAGDVLQLVVTPEHDPLGTPVETWTEQDIVAVNGPAFSGRTSLFDMGSGRFTIPRSVWENSSINARRTYYVRAYIPYIDSNPIFGMWLLSGAFILASSDEIGGETVTVGGPGPMHYLKFAIIPYQPWDEANAEVEDGTWYFEDQSHGEVMARLINQDGDSDYPALAALTSSSFGVSTDTDGNPWPANNGMIALQRGISYFDALRELQRSGSLDAWMTANLNLRMFGSPEYGRDLTGLSYGAGVVRFAGSGLGPLSSEPKNILDDLTRNRDGGGGVTHCLAVGRDKKRNGHIVEGSPIHHWYVRGDFDPATDAIKQGYIEYDTNNLNILERAARRYMRKTHERAGQMADFAIKPGQDESTGLYLPGPPGSTRGNFWFGDTVTLKTGGSGNDLDFTDADLRVAAIRMDLDEAASDKNATEKQLSWQVAVEAGDDDPSGGGGGNGSAEPGRGSTCRCLELCPATVEGTPFVSHQLLKANDAGGDPINWTGSLANQGGSGDGAAGTDFYYFKSNSPTTYQNSLACSAGDSITAFGYWGCRSAGHLILGFGTAPGGTAGTGFVGTVIGTPTDLHADGPSHSHADEWTFFSISAVAPSGAQSYALGHANGTIDFDEVETGDSEVPASNPLHGTDRQGAHCDHIHHHFAAADPTVDDDLDAGYRAGTFWVNTATEDVFISIDDSSGAAVWLQVNTGGGGGSGHAITEDGGAALTARANLDFRHGLDVADDSGTNSTRVAVDESELSHNSLADLTTGDPHTQYATDSDLSTHAAAADPHPAYMLEALASAKGEVWGASADNTPAMVAASTEGQMLVGRAAETAGNKFETIYETLTLIIGNGVAVIPTGVKGYVPIEFNGEIVSVRMGADVSGSVVLDIWNDTHANYQPTVADTITASAKPTISATTKSLDTTLTGWSKTLDDGDWLAFNIDSCTSIKQLTVSIKIKRT